MAYSTVPALFLNNRFAPKSIAPIAVILNFPLPPPVSTTFNQSLAPKYESPFTCNVADGVVVPIPTFPFPWTLNRFVAGVAGVVVVNTLNVEPPVAAARLIVPIHFVLSS